MGFGSPSFLNVFTPFSDLPLLNFLAWARPAFFFFMIAFPFLASSSAPEATLHVTLWHRQGLSQGWQGVSGKSDSPRISVAGRAAVCARPSCGVSYSAQGFGTPLQMIAFASADEARGTDKNHGRRVSDGNILVGRSRDPGVDGVARRR